jgi:aldehyde dehydrogenase (NAD+)
MMEGLDRFYIDGAWCTPESGESMDVINPASEQVIGRLALGSPADIDRAVAAANAAFDEWSRTTREDRLALLKSLLAAYERRYEEMAVAISTEMGAPITMARRSQADCGRGHLAAFIDALEKQESRVTLDNGDTLVREPIGICGLITPWNWPMNQVALKVYPALATGCCCILKPSEYTPLSAELFAELVDEAGYPAGVFNMVHGIGPVAGAALSAHPDVQMISFTGSTRAGRAISRDAAETIKRVTLELGGKSPFVVFPDADLERAIPGAVRGCFFLQGQNCMASTRLFVHEDIYEPMVEGIAAMAGGMQPGPGLDPASMLGPLISEQQRDRVMGYIDAGKQSDAELRCGGEALPGKGFFVRPTVFGQTNMEMKIAREEIFGPVMCIQTFGDSDLDTVADEANNTIYGLSGSVWTKDISVAHRMAAKIDSGQVSINCHAAVDPAIPFGGNKQSGWGREFGQEGLEPYLKTKATTVLF